jgi:hypothetical protein
MQLHSTPTPTAGPASVCSSTGNANPSTIRLYNPMPSLGKFDGRGWKTINGAKNEAHELSICLCMNASLWGGYAWDVTIYVHRTLDENDVKKLWAFVARNLDRAGVVAFWRREVTPTHRVHYHLMVASPFKKDALADAINHAFPAGYRAGRKAFRMCIKTAKDTKVTARYILKAKVAGISRRTGKPSKDLYAYKRHLFLPHVRMKMVGVIGPFWKEKKEDLWKKVIQRERDLAAKVTPQLIAEAEDVHEALGPVFALPDLIRHLAAVEIAYDKKMARLKAQAAGLSEKTIPVIISVTLPNGTTINAPVIKTDQNRSERLSYLR